MRGVAWSLKRLRTWVALAAACAATAMASADGRTGWTVTVAVVTFGLAGLSMRAHFLDAHADRPDPKQSRHDERVEAILRRYQETQETGQGSRLERRAARRR